MQKELDPWLAFLTADRNIRKCVERAVSPNNRVQLSMSSVDRVRASSVDIFELALVDEPLWRMFGRLLEIGTRRLVAAERHTQTFFHYGALTPPLISE